MTPSFSDKQLIWLVAVIVLACVGVAACLAWHNQAAAIAAFLTLAGQALGILSPSPLRQHNQGGGDTSIDASKADTVNVAAPSAAPAEPGGV